MASDIGLAERRIAPAKVRTAADRRKVEVRAGVHGIVLAGVYPDARSPLDRLMPRPLLPVVQQPLIEHVLQWLGADGVPRAMICTNSGSRAVRTRLESAGGDMQLGYAEDWSPRGPAGCVRDAGLATDADTFVVADATSIPLVDIGALLATHRTESAAITVAVTADALGRLRPCDVYVFDRRTFAFIPAQGFQDIKERLIPALHGAGERVALHVTRTAAPRVVSARSYLALDQWAVERAASLLAIPAGFRLQGESIVHESAQVHPDARLLGPVMIGPEASVDAEATLVGPTDIGARVRIGKGAVVSRSVLWTGATVGEQAFVDRSMLPEGAVVTARESAMGVLK